MDWYSQVNQMYAVADGRSPDEFRFDQWPVGNVRLGHFTPQERAQFPAVIVLAYRCTMPAATPHANQYDLIDGQYVARPDPAGMVLSSVRFQLRDPETQEVLDDDSRDHVDGRVLGMLGEGAPLWQRLLPGTELRVQLAAWPLFFFLADDGGVQAQYAIGNQGYFKGAEHLSPVYVLSMTADGDVLVDGEAASPAPALVEELTPEEIELRAQMEREQAEYRRERQEAAERKARQKAEQDAAKRLIYGRRGDYGSVEDWLLGVLFDKSIDFTVRKRVSMVADEVGFDLDAARRRRQAAREREAAERKRRYEAEQADAALADNVRLFEQYFLQQGASDVEAKAKLLRCIYHDPSWDRYDRAAEVVAERLGVTL